MWTQTAEVDEYCTFLDNLFEIMHEEQSGGDDGEGGKDGWRPVREIVSLSPLLAQWTQPEDEEEDEEDDGDAEEPKPPPRSSSRPAAPAPRPPLSKVGSTKARSATTLGRGHVAIGAAPKKEAPAHKTKGTSGASSAGGAPAGQLKALSSAPIEEEAVKKLADLDLKMLFSPMRSPLKAAVNAQRALMAMQGADVQTAPFAGKERAELPQPHGEACPSKKVDGGYVMFTGGAAGAPASLGVYDMHDRPSA